MDGQLHSWVNDCHVHYFTSSEVFSLEEDRSKKREAVRGYISGNKELSPDQTTEKTRGKRTKYILNICWKAGQYLYSEEFLGQKSKKREVQEDRAGIFLLFSVWNLENVS